MKVSSSSKKVTGPSRATIAILVLLFLMVACYVGYQIAANVSSPYATAAVYPFSSNDETTVNGYVIREESLLPQQGSGILNITRREGEKVAKGESVATVYSDSAAMDVQKQIEAHVQQLEHLNFALKESTGASSGIKLDTEIHKEILTLRQDLQSKQFSSLDQDTEDLKTLVIKRSYAGGEASVEELTSRIQTVKAELKDLYNRQSKNVKRVYVSSPGLFSAVVDGYETVLTPDTLVSLTPSKLDSLLPNTSYTSDVGKMICGDTWYYAANMDQEAAETYRVGQTVQLHFVKDLDRDLAMQVESVSPVENGERTVVFSCDRFLPEVTLLRHQSANLIHDSYEGLRVPTEALRVEEEQTGVYCLVGMRAVFKPVDVVFRGSGYYLVSPSLQEDDTENESSSRLRNGDLVLITAEELYTGKVIQS